MYILKMFLNVKNYRMDKSVIKYEKSVKMIKK